jgi:acetylornithine deacetylase/succinyl-diaminopimelate desuccinylase-like protein
MDVNISEYIEDNKDNHIEELLTWLRMPSISTLSEHAGDVRTAALWAKNKLEKTGFPCTELVEGQGHPLVYGEWQVDEEKPTLLFYGHYDVQPVDPLAEWNKPPFEPYIKDGNIYARGASDDKGQVMIVLAALEAWAKAKGNLPVNVKILLEGEEEAGGAFVGKYVYQNKERLKADTALICDTHMNSVEQPSIITGLRGILYTEIHVRGAKKDLHSGSYGGVAPNPLHALCLLISRLKGEDGRIDIPGIYVSSLNVAEEEEHFWQKNKADFETRLIEEMGVEMLVGENHVLPHKRIGTRPTLEVHGIRGGFVGEGAKTVIPSEALAKISIRLPADMQPNEVFLQFEKVIREKMPKGYKIEVRNIHGGSGVSVSSKNTYVQNAAAALEATYKIKPVYMREGGSIPIAALLDEVLQMPVVLMGFGLPDDGVHGPNEKFSVSQFHKGIHTVADYLGRLAEKA